MNEVKTKRTQGFDRKRLAQTVVPNAGIFSHFRPGTDQMERGV
jgi:hypothetical protein